MQTPLIGRERELAAILRVIRPDRQQGGALVLVADAGMGKTRLLDEAAARLDDVLVVRGRSSDRADAPDHWPWIQALRALRLQTSSIRLADSRRAAAILGRVVPELVEVLQPAVLADEPSPFEVRDALASAFVHAGNSRPVVVVLDDLHQADEASHSLLRHLLPSTRQSQLSILAAMRPTPDGEALDGTSTDLEVLHLGGLGAPEVNALVASIDPGSRPTRAETEALRRRTGGNPFHVLSLARARSVGDGTPVPLAVRDLVRARVASLPDAGRHLLRAIAVIGEGADEALIAAVAGQSTTTTAHHLRVLADMDLLRAGDLARWEMAHDLLRDAVIAECDTTTRRHLEAATAQHLQERSDGDAMAAKIAHHLTEALPEASVGDTVAWLVRAADHAMRRLAYAEAVQHLERADALMTASGADGQRLESLLRLGEARTRAIGPPAARGTYAAAQDLARERGRPVDHARAVLGRCESVRQFPGFYMDPLEPLTAMNEALAMLEGVPGTDADTTRAQLLATRALHLVIDGDPDAASEAERASRLARAGTDPVARGLAAVTRRAAMYADTTPDQRRQATRDLRELADRSADGHLLWRSHHYAFVDALVAGDPVGASKAAAACTTLSTRLGEPYLEAMGWIWQACLAMSQGRLQDLGTIHEAAGRAIERADGAGIETLGGQRIYLAGEQGSQDTSAVDGLALMYPDRQVLHALRCWCHLRAGSTDLAQTLLDEALAAGLDPAPRDDYWLPTLTMLAEVASTLGDTRAAAGLLRRLRSLPDQCIPTAGAPMGWPGPLRHYTGMLRLAVGDVAGALVDLRAALLVVRRMSARMTEARTLALLGDAHEADGAPSAAAECRTGARALATQLGMRWLVERLDQAEATTSDVDVRRAALRRRQAGWEIVSGTTTDLVDDIRGMSHLAVLLARPGLEHHALDLEAGLVAPTTSIPTEGLSARRGGDAGPVLDGEAIAAYRQRLAELDEELSRALPGDPASPSGALEDERRALQEQLDVGTGLSGRPKFAADEVERARVNVTRAIRTAIDRIRHVDRALAEDLDVGVRTGRRCSYDPPGGVLWSVEH